MNGNIESGTKGKSGCDPCPTPFQTELETNAASS